MRNESVLGIDVGGTYTDLVLLASDGTLRVHKVLNGPSGADAAVQGAVEIADAPDMVSTVVHGTTVATNAVLERKGAVTVLATTAGFRDVLELQRQDRLDVWDLEWRKPVPLVPRERRIEVDERLGPEGEVLRPLDVESAADAVLRAVDQAEAEAVAICFLHAYRYGAHERSLAEWIQQRRPDLHVSESHRVAAQFREYDRMSTTALNAYLSPVIGRHLERFGAAMRARGFRSEILVMQSNGGVVPLHVGAEIAASLCLSGPAGGVLAAAQVAQSCDEHDLICLDMGGTSTDVALVRGMLPEVSYDSSIDGLPTILPMFRIETVGAGGGSIISVDEGGLLQVGPRSAGAEPGPACYGRGGDLPTVTDAWCALGVIRDDMAAERYLRPDRQAAVSVLTTLAARLETSVEDAAWQALRITTANMSRALRLVSIEQGHDPRTFALVAYGGAGGLHAALCAEELGITRVLVPMNAGVFSAYGMVCADVVRNYVQTHLLPLTEQSRLAVFQHLDALMDQARRDFKDYGIDASPQFLARVDTRYEGQAHDVPVAVDLEVRQSAEEIKASFHALHEARYGFRETQTAVEVVNVRLEARLARPRPSPRDVSVSVVEPVFRDVCLGSTRSWAFVAREAMAVGQSLPGPAVVEESTSTTVVPSGWVAERDAKGQLWLTRT